MFAAFCKCGLLLWKGQMANGIWLLERLANKGCQAGFRHGMAGLVQVMTQRDLHDDLLDSGVLGVLKSWLEPLPDGNLPNVKAGPHDASLQWNALWRKGIQVLFCRKPSVFGLPSKRKCHEACPRGH